jgi:predicted transposase YdaD
MYDDTCKFLAEHFSADFASWLLGEPVTLTEIQPSVREALPLGNTFPRPNSGRCHDSAPV